MPGNRDQPMPDANFLAQKMPDERFSRICKLAFNDSNFDCEQLDYEWFCSCGFDPKDDSKKVGVRSKT